MPYQRRFPNTRQGQLLLPGLLVLASLLITSVQAGHQKKAGAGTAPCSSQVNQADTYKEVAPTLVTSGLSQNKTTVDNSSELKNLSKIQVPASASDELNRLVSTLEGKGILCKTTFVTMLEKVVAREPPEASSVSTLPGKRNSPKRAPTRLNPQEASTTLSARIFLQKANIFFSHMNKETAGSRSAKPIQLSTGSLTGVVGFTCRSLTSFVRCSDEFLKEIAQLESLKTFTSLYGRKGFPGTLEHFRKFEALFGEGEEKIPGRHRNHFTSMQNTRGVPTNERVLRFWQWLKDNRHEAAIASLSGLLHGMGIPDPDETKPGSPMQALKDFVGLFGEGDMLIPRHHLSHFTSMASHRRIPGKERVWGYWQWLKDNDLEAVMASLSGLLHTRGIPDPGDTRPGSPMQGLRDFVGLFGKGKEQIPRRHLPHFTSMHHGRGVPTKEQVLRFWQWIKDNALETVMASLSGFLNGNGIPDPDDTQPDSTMQALEGFIGLFGNGEAQIPRQYLCKFTSIQNGKGVPVKKRVWRFWQWIKGNKLEPVMASLSSLLVGCGIPDPDDTKPGSTMEKLKDFIGLFGDGEKQIPLYHLAHFTSMQHGKGVPAKKQVLRFWQWVKESRLKAVMASLSGLLNGCGIPNPGDTKPGSSMQALKDFIGLFGEGNKPIPLHCLPHFTSMQNGRAVPAREQVLGFWQWLKDNDLEAVLAPLSSMLGGHGIPNNVETKPGFSMPALKDFVELFGSGEGQIPLEYLTYFTSMNVRRGLPPAQDVKALYAWLGDDRQWLIRHVARLFNGRGIPSLKELEQYQTHLQELTGIPLTEDAASLKILALHRAVPDQNNLSEHGMKNCLSLLGQQAGNQKKGAQVLAGLLGRHRKAGIEMYKTLVEKNTEWNPADIITLLMEARHLSLARVAINDIWQGRAEHLADARQFLALAMNLKPVPGVRQWREFKEDYLPVLVSVILPGKWQNLRYPASMIPARTLRFYWESLWKMTIVFRSSFLNEECLRVLLKGVQSVAGLHSLSRCYDTIRFEEQCCCLMDFFSHPRACTTERESDSDRQGRWTWVSQLLRGNESISPGVWQQLENNRYCLPHSIVHLLDYQSRPDMPEQLRSYVQDQVLLDEGVAYVQEDESALFGTGYELPPELQQSLLRELPPGQLVLTESILKELEPRTDKLSDNQLEDVVTRLDINLPFGERTKWVDRCYERQQPQASLKSQPVSMEQWADSAGLFTEDEFSDDAYYAERLSE